MEGIEVRHKKTCRSKDGRGCNCEPGFRASVWSPRDGKQIKQTFSTKAAAKSWRHDAIGQLRRGALRPPAKERLRDAADAWLIDVRSGQLRNRSGDPYKPSAIRSYERALRLRVLPALGDLRLSDIRRRDVQDLADKLGAKGLNPSTIDSTLNPLRAIFRRAVARGEVATNPTRQLELPAVRSKLKRIASPQEAARLLAAVPEGDRPVWATAMYAGLRRGELRALEGKNIDLALGVIYVEQSWDDKEGPVETKSREKRRVPIPAVLRPYLEGIPRTGLAFGRSPIKPFDPGTLTDRADTAWKEAKLLRITPHECRHTFASLMIAAGVNPKAISTFMGHASIEITFDTYGHLMPGSEDEAAGMLDLYLAKEPNGKTMGKTPIPSASLDGS